MNRDTIREHLLAGGTMDGRVLDAQEQVIARGKVSWKGTTWIAVQAGRAVELQLLDKGQSFRAPLAEPVQLRKGQEVTLEFGPKWQ